jgi:hypothetical protein
VLLLASPAAAEDATEQAPAETATPKVEAPAANAPAPAAQPEPVQAVALPAPKAALPIATTPAAKTTVEVPRAPSAGGPAVTDSESWKFEFHGYIRAPMRLGLGKRDPSSGCLASTTTPGSPCPGPGQSSLTVHAPVIPDDQYLGWQSTAHNKKDWAEMFFSVGNSWAKGTVSIQGYNFTESSYNEPSTQFGIAQGYVDLTPDLGYENVRMDLRAGAFWNKYGTAGKYDAGEYDTYLFGRTHVAGETLHLDFDLSEQDTLWVEHGIGAKRPDPSLYNNSRFTLLNHAHVGFNHTQDMQFTANYLSSWTQEEERAGDGETSIINLGDGKMWVAGLDGRFELGALGYLYFGYSHIGLTRALTVARAIEVLHASGGGEFGLGVTDNYLGPSCRTDALAPVVPAGQDPRAGCSLGTGKVDSLLGQYEFSLTNATQLASGGQKFWGDGQDLKLVAYGMLNEVKSDYAPNDGLRKFKYGADLQFAALPWLTAAVRFDRVLPNQRIPEQSFAILSPRLVFKSNWVTRESISVQYSRYFYAQRTCAGFPLVTPSDGTFQPGQDRCVQPPTSPVPPDGFGALTVNQTGMRSAPTTRPDLNVFKVEATMWW